MYRSESLFDSDEKMSEMSCDEYPVFRTKESKKNLRGKGGRKVNARTYKLRGGGEASPPDVFLRFSLDGQTSAPDVFSRCSFFTDAHFETVFVIISYSCYEI